MMMGRVARTAVRTMTGPSLSQRVAAVPHCCSRMISGEDISFTPSRRAFDVFCSVAYSYAQRRLFHARPRNSLFPGEIRGLVASMRRFRRMKRRQPAKKRALPENREVELRVKVCVEDSLSRDSDVLNVAEMLRLNAAIALKIALDGFKDSRYLTRDSSISNVGKYERIELNVVLCNDAFIRKLNIDKAVNFIAVSRHIPYLDLPILILGDIVISVESAASKAEEKDHKLLDEIRILLVEGLLDLLGFDPSISDDAQREATRELELILGSLGWRKKINQEFLEEGL